MTLETKEDNTLCFLVITVIERCKEFQLETYCYTDVTIHSKSHHSNKVAYKSLIHRLITISLDSSITKKNLTQSNKSTLKINSNAPYLIKFTRNICKKPTNHQKAKPTFVLTEYSRILAKIITSTFVKLNRIIAFQTNNAIKKCLPPKKHQTTNRNNRCIQIDMRQLS